MSDQKPLDEEELAILARLEERKRTNTMRPQDYISLAYYNALREQTENPQSTAA